MKGIVCHGKELKSNLAENRNTLTGQWQNKIRVLETDQSGSSVDDGEVWEIRLWHFFFVLVGEIC